MRNREAFKELLAADIPANVATLVLKAKYLNTAIMVWAEAKRGSKPVSEMVIRILAVARSTRLGEVIADLANRPASGEWEPIALGILHHRYTQLLRNLVRKIDTNGEEATVDLLAQQLETGALADVRAQFDELLASEDQPSVATLLVLEERVAAATARVG